MWDREILPSLVSFANCLDLFMDDPDQQKQFVESEDGRIKKKIIRSLQRREMSEGTGGRPFQNDGQPNYEKLKVVQLKDLCRQRRLAVGGLKRQLIDRLEEYDRDQD